MFVRRFLKNRRRVHSIVYGNMKDTNINDVIIKDGHLIKSKFESKYNETNDVIPTAVNINDDFHILQRRRSCRLVENVIPEQSLSIICPDKDVQENLDPILEYAEEPLLPLTEACVPLLSIIHNLSAYIELALRETPLEPSDNLTFDESAAIRLYTIEWNEPRASLYSKLNSTLKSPDRQTLRPYYKYLKLLLTALVKLPCVPLQTVWRGVNKDLSNRFPHGTPVTWWAFSSCTASLTVLENNIYLSTFGERTLFSVEASNGRKIRDHSHFDFEDEILLLPGTYMEVQSQLSPATGLHIIHLKQIKPNKTLLELPFEGALLYPPEHKKKPCYKKKRNIIQFILLILLCLAGIIIGAVYGVKHHHSSPICRTRPVGIKSDLFWSFDCGDAREELKGLLNGTSENDANYSTPDFSGQGKALNLNRKLNQYIRLPSSLNLTRNTNFTVSFWMFSTGYNWATILSDCDTINSICIEFLVYSVVIYVKTYNLNNVDKFQLVGYNAYKVNYQSCWIHLTFTFDNKRNILAMHFNGVRVVSGPFSLNNFITTNTNGSIASYIGSGAVLTNNSPFDGLIDQLSISYSIKNDNEILDEATLLCNYNFESDDINYDSGPNNIQAYSENVNRSSTNDSYLIFNSKDSYFQSSGFTLLMSNSYSFSITFWIRPIILKTDKLNNAIAILQLASKVQQISSESYVCFLSVLIANISSNTPYFRVEYGQLNMYSSLNNFVVKNNTWTHFGISYSDGGRNSFYINGRLIDRGAIDTRFSLLLYNPRLAVTIGGNYFDDMITIKPTKYQSRQCFAQNPDFNFTQMYGAIDDLKVYARALTDNEFATLAQSKNETIS